MNACVLHGIGDLRYEKVPDVQAGAGEVLVHIKACGICGSDIPRVFTKGTYHFPTIPGHEFAGVVEAVGQDVEKDWIGKKVAVFPLIPCGKCEACKKGNYAQCENYNYFGSRCDGGFAEYVAVPVWNLVLVPEEVSYEEAALCEPAAVAYHAVSRAEILPGENVLIVGAGTIGLLVALWARSAGAAQIFIADIDDRNLEFAKKMGFQNVINSGLENVSERIQDLSSGEGVRYAFDCVGVAIALENCLESVNNFGKVVTVGNPASDITLKQNVYWNILRKELTLLGTWNSSYCGKNHDWNKVMKALHLGMIDIKPLIMHRFSLKDYEKAFLTMRERKEFVVKVLFVDNER